MEINKPGQLTYFAAIPMPTTDKGIHFLFFAVDHFNKATYNLGVDEKLNEEVLFKKLKQLLETPEFKSISKELFTIMFPIGEEISDKFKTILPKNGYAIFDEKATQEVAKVLVDLGILGNME